MKKRSRYLAFFASALLALAVVIIWGSSGASPKYQTDSEVLRQQIAQYAGLTPESLEVLQVEQTERDVFALWTGDNGEMGMTWLQCRGPGRFSRLQAIGGNRYEADSDRLHKYITGDSETGRSLLVISGRNPHIGSTCLVSYTAPLETQPSNSVESSISLSLNDDLVLIPLWCDSSSVPVPFQVEAYDADGEALPCF